LQQDIWISLMDASLRPPASHHAGRARPVSQTAPIQGIPPERAKADNHEEGDSQQ
jgi:hypothetical protein